MSLAKHMAVFEITLSEFEYGRLTDRVGTLDRRDRRIPAAMVS